MLGKKTIMFLEGKLSMEELKIYALKNKLVEEKKDEPNQGVIQNSNENVDNKQC